MLFSRQEVEAERYIKEPALSDGTHGAIRILPDVAGIAG